MRAKKVGYYYECEWAKYAIKCLKKVPALGYTFNEQNDDTEVLQ